MIQIKRSLTYSLTMLRYVQEKLQICCVTALLCCARDEEAAVRAAALQALAAYLAFPTFGQVS